MFYKAELELRYNKILNEIQSCNAIKYAAYRTASKLLVIYKSLKFDCVTFRLVKGIFERHNLRATDNHLLLSLEQVDNILYDTFFAAFKEKGIDSDANLSAELAKLFLSKIFKVRDDYVSVFNLKVYLVLLCCTSLQSKYQYWFFLLVDHNFCLPKRRLRPLLEALLQVTDFLSESATFSNELIEPTIESCFTEEHISLGINENDWMCWLAKEPQLLVWLSTFYRLSTSVKVVHNVPCAVCGLFPIVGLRYHCLRCIRYDLCQSCFFTARSSKRHKTNHLIREYCSQTSFYETTATFLKEIFKRFCGNSSKLQYLPVQYHSNFKRQHLGVKSDSEISVESKNVEEEDDKKTITNHLNVRQQIEKIITDIETEARVLNDAVDNISTSVLVNHHAVFMNEHVNKLKVLKNELEKTQKNDLPIELEIRSVKSKKEGEMGSISSDSSWHIPSPSGFSTWLEGGQHETTYTNQLHNDLETIMKKLNNMLETNFLTDEDSSEVSVITKDGS